MNYSINKVYDLIVNDEQTVLITDEISHVFILNKIESAIFDIFKAPTSITDSYNIFKKDFSHIYVSEEDYMIFVSQLIENEILIISK